MLASKRSRDACLFCPIMSFKYQTPKNNVSGNVSNGLNKGHSSGSAQPYHVGAGLQIHIVWDTTQASHVTKDREVGVRWLTASVAEPDTYKTTPMAYLSQNLGQNLFSIVQSFYSSNGWMLSQESTYTQVTFVFYVCLIFVTFSCASNSKKKIPICKMNFWN